MKDLKPLADVEAVLKLIPGSDDDPELIEELLWEASDLIRVYTRRDFADGVPDVVARVAARMVARTLSGSAAGGFGVGGGFVPAGANSLSQQAGPFSQSYGFSEGATDGGIWLSKSDKLRLRGYRGTAYSIRAW